jgi:hypothetical protein
MLFFHKILLCIEIFSQANGLAKTDEKNRGTPGLGIKGVKKCTISMKRAGKIIWLARFLQGGDKILPVCEE